MRDDGGSIEELFVRCLKGVSPFDFADVSVIHCVNHPADHGGGYQILGHLRFIRAEDRSAAGGAYG